MPAGVCTACIQYCIIMLGLISAVCWSCDSHVMPATKVIALNCSEQVTVLIYVLVQYMYIVCHQARLYFPFSCRVWKHACADVVLAEPCFVIVHVHTRTCVIACVSVDECILAYYIICIYKLRTSYMRHLFHTSYMHTYGAPPSLPIPPHLQISIHILHSLQKP